jgi:uncharacterized protein YbaR (Trm112 family)
MQSQWDKINQNKAEKEEAMKSKEESFEKVEDQAEKIQELLKRMSDAQLGTPEDVKELSVLFGKYHSAKAMQTIAIASLNVLGMTGGLMFEKTMAHHNLVCPNDSMYLIPHGYFEPISKPEEKNFETTEEYNEAFNHYTSCMSNYSEFAEGKLPEELIKMKGYFVCPQCGRVYRIEHIGKDGRENSKVISLYNAIKKELSR